MNAQINAYLAVGYACNQKCRCCPITRNIDVSNLFAPFDRVKREVDSMISLGVTDVTISGGEPTIHPDFFNIIDLFFENDITVHILSNGEKFSDPLFFDKFLKNANGKSICITTTFHSFMPDAHEFQNQTKGSFERSFKGLKALDSHGVNIAIKHCITANNYRELPQFIEWALTSFSNNAEIQLWGIDVCGISDDLANEVFIDYKRIGEYVEQALDLFEAHELHNDRILTINNLPLCMCDAYYWKYFTPPEADNYIEHMDDGRKMDAISGPASRNCFSCKFRAYCTGVYYSNFDLFGDDIVSPPVNELRASSYASQVTSYNQENIEFTFLSPYIQIELHPSGFRLWNTRLSDYALIRAKTKQVENVLALLNNGTQDDILVDAFNNCGLNGAEVLKELILKGIIE